VWFFLKMKIKIFGQREKSEKILPGLEINIGK
jgi:hypothetical protein